MRLMRAVAPPRTGGPPRTGRPRRRRWPARWLLAAAVVVVATAVGVGGWLLTRSGVLGVRSVVVRGATGTLAGQVRTAAHVRPGVPLLEVDLAGVRARVARLSRVAGVRVTRDWPHTLLLTVSLRTPVAVYRGAAGSWLVDASGVAFAPAPAVSPLPDLAVSTPPAGSPPRWPAGSAGAAAARVAAELPGWLRARLLTVGGAWPDGVTLRLRGGRWVVWGAPDDAAEKAAALQVLLRRTPGTIDLSAPGMAAVR